MEIIIISKTVQVGLLTNKSVYILHARAVVKHIVLDHVIHTNCSIDSMRKYLDIIAHCMIKDNADNPLSLMLH